MARMPGTTWMGEQSPGRPMTRYDVVCVHTIVGWAPAHAAHFSVKLDGQIIQSRDTRYQSAANLDGNYRVIAIENEDGAEWWKPLTEAQVDANARILAWAHEEHGIPLQLCPDSRPSSRGLAYHRQGIDGNFTDGYSGRVSGGETWTEHFGKVCPGAAKIAQLPDILARAQGDDMAQYDDLLTGMDKKLDALLKQEKGERERDKADRERWRKLRQEVRAGKRDVKAALEEALAELDPQ